MEKRLWSVLLCAMAMLTLTTAASAAGTEQGIKQDVIQVSAAYRDLSDAGTRSSDISAMLLADELGLDQRYGRDGLASLTDGAKLVAAYDLICAGVANKEETISIYSAGMPVDQMELVLEAYRNDNPQHYWLGNRYSYSSSGDVVSWVSPEYRSELLHADAEFESAVNGYLAQVAGMTDSRAIALKLHDLLCEDITYVLNATNAHNAYGALVEHEAVCEGYARAYQLLLNRAGIESFVVTGSSKGQGHAWNMVKLGNDWVQADVTWDDQVTDTYHYYFASTSAQMAEDHTMTVLPYALPNCTTTDYRCFTVELGNSFSTLTVDGVAALMKPTKDGRTCALEYTGTEPIMDWLGENAVAVIQKLGGTGSFGYSVAWLGKEYHVTFTGTFPDQCHVEVLIPGKAATCTEAGLTDGKKCSLCGEILVVQTVIPAKGHTEAKVDGKAATCTASGLTEGKKCSVCNEVIVAPTVIPAKGHTEVTVPGKAATCTASGLTEGKKCSVCGEVLVAQTTIPVKGHTEVKVVGKAATCTASGLTEGKKCSVCGEVTVAQTTIPAKGHTWDSGVITTAPTTTAQGVKTYTCTVCKATRTESIPMLTAFEDVSAKAWYASYVNKAAELGLMNGVGNGCFNPMGTTTRAMFVQVLYSMEKKPAVTFNHPFTDVNNNLWYAKAIQWAYTNKVTNGTSATTFGPNQNVTREQIAVFLYSYMGKPPASGNLAAFKDGAKVSSWAKSAVIWATQNGVISGAQNSDGTLYLNPQNQATRAETAAMMVKFYPLVNP